MERLDGDTVHFVDGTSDQFDVIVYATGYNITFPFFDRDFLSAPENHIPLYKRIYKPGFDTLSFVGFAQSTPTLFPFVESQSRLVAAHLIGEYALPGVSEMLIAKALYPYPAGLAVATATLQGGLKASEAQGTPISAKFEIEDGKLQLSVYTMKGSDFMEVVADPNTGTIAKAEKITDAGDLKEAAEQKATMAKAKVPLLTATETAVNANAGSRAVSIVPELKNGQATAEVTLLQGTSFKKVTEKLD